MKQTSLFLEIALLLVILSTMGLSITSRPTPHSEGQWQMAGQGPSDTRDQAAEHLISPSNVRKLVPRWVFTSHGDVSATPTVAGNAVYVPDWGGYLYAIEKDTGKLIWSHKISEYDGYPGAVSRVSPAVHGDELIVGDIQSEKITHDGANVIAVNRKTGKMLWKTQVDSNPAAIITGSPVLLGNVVFQGVSSVEEGLASDPTYPCCSFRGSMVALNANTGAILWKTYDMPTNGGRVGGYTGGAIWQPSAIDKARDTLYVGTGNNYTVPTSVLDCEAQAIAADDPQKRCAAPDDHFDSALALNMTTGKIKWATGLKSYDAWNEACGSPGPGTACPGPFGSDYDLGGSGPNLLGKTVGFGQKNGIYWELNAETGKIVWGKPVGPGSVGGGIEWGTATDGRRIYVPIANFGHRFYRLLPSGTQINWGSWSALDAVTGKILWQTADPVAGSADPGAATVANGVVYVGSFDAKGHMYALDAKTGKVLWSFASGGSVVDSPSIVGGYVYWGSGYRRYGTGNNKLYAFSVIGSEGAGHRRQN